MLNRIFLVFVSFACLLFSGVVWADGHNSQSGHVWSVSKINGIAYIEAEGREPLRIRRDRSLFPGQTLRTVSRTRLLLTRGKERIQVGSNTIIRLPGFDELKPGWTEITQTHGTLHLSVEKKNVKHFSIKTPFLVAAVKGTKFTVNVTNDTAKVAVQEGIVEINNRLEKEKTDITSGQSAIVRHFQEGASDNSLNRVANPSRLSRSAQSIVIVDPGEEDPYVTTERLQNEILAQSEPKQGLFSLTWGFFASFLSMCGGFAHSMVNGMIYLVASPFRFVSDLIFETDYTQLSFASVIRLFLVALAAILALAGLVVKFLVKKQQ